MSAPRKAAAPLSFNTSFAHAESWLKQIAALDVSYAPTDGEKEIDRMHAKFRPAGVLVLWALSAGVEGKVRLSLLLTRRSSGRGSHRGQIAFPGGGTESFDSGDITQTAIRETTEEVGIAPNQIQAVGKLPPLRTTTGYEVHPVLALLKIPVGQAQLRIDTTELDEAWWVALQDLMHPQTFRLKKFERLGVDYLTPVYVLGLDQVWGLTALVIQNVLERFQRVPGFEITAS